MRHVWLPTLGAWAQVQPSSVAVPTCQSSESGAEAASCSNVECPSTNTRKRSGGSHSHDCKSCQRHQHRWSPQRDEHKRHQDRHDLSCHHDEHHNHHHQSHHTCPICLSPISQSSLTVLRWCMHKFCVTCIEKWSCIQRFCPLCKQTFHGWYYNIKSPSIFEKKSLAAKLSSSPLHTRRRRERYPGSRQPISLSVGSSRALPWRQDFRFSRNTASNHFKQTLDSKPDEAALKWRASVYKKNLRAVLQHVKSRVKIKQAPANDPARKERIERRLEPWIRRELHAIMEDPDPSILVHLVLSLWLHALSEKEMIVKKGIPEHQCDRLPCTGPWDSEAIRQLEPFLQEKASMFWHELSCFSESPFSLQTYDSVTKYKKFRG